MGSPPLAAKSLVAPAADQLLLVGPQSAQVGLAGRDLEAEQAVGPQDPCDLVQDRLVLAVTEVAEAVAEQEGAAERAGPTQATLTSPGPGQSAR